MPRAKLESSKTRNRIDILAAQLMQRRLEQGNASYNDLAAISGVSVASVGRWMRLMRDAEMVHVTAYSEDRLGRPFVPLFTWGKGQDLPRPGQSRPAAVRMADLRQRRAALIEQLKKSH